MEHATAGMLTELGERADNWSIALRVTRFGSGVTDVFWVEREIECTAYSLVGEEDDHEELNYIWIDRRRERLYIDDELSVQNTYMRSPGSLRMSSTSARTGQDWGESDRHASSSEDQAANDSPVETDGQ